jgi:hypothetical protein
MLSQTLKTLYRKLYPEDGSFPVDEQLLAARQSQDEHNRLSFGLLSQIGQALVRQEQVIMLIAQEHAKLTQAAPVGQTQSEALDQAVDMESPMPATQATVTSMMPAAVPATNFSTQPAVAGGTMVSISAPTPAIAPAAAQS